MDHALNFLIPYRLYFPISEKRPLTLQWPMQIVLFFLYDDDELKPDVRFLYSFAYESRVPFFFYDYLAEMFFSFILHLPKGSLNIQIKLKLIFHYQTVFVIIRKSNVICQLSFYFSQINFPFIYYVSILSTGSVYDIFLLFFYPHHISTR